MMKVRRNQQINLNQKNIKDCKNTVFFLTSSPFPVLKILILSYLLILPGKTWYPGWEVCSLRRIFRLTPLSNSLKVPLICGIFFKAITYNLFNYSCSEIARIKASLFSFIHSGIFSPSSSH